MYQLVQRYQDSNWELINGEVFQNKQDAVKRAKKCSNNSIAYGTVGVIYNGEFIAVFSEGNEVGEYIKMKPVMKTLNSVVLDKLSELEKQIKELKDYVRSH